MKNCRCRLLPALWHLLILGVAFSQSIPAEFDAGLELDEVTSSVCGADVDDFGNTFVAGFARGPKAFDFLRRDAPHTPTDNAFLTKHADMFVGQIDESGNIVWAITGGTDGVDGLFDIVAGDTSQKDYSLYDDGLRVDVFTNTTTLYVGGTLDAGRGTFYSYPSGVKTIGNPSPRYRTRTCFASRIDVVIEQSVSYDQMNRRKDAKRTVRATWTWLTAFPESAAEKDGIQAMAFLPSIATTGESLVLLGGTFDNNCLLSSLYTSDGSLDTFRVCEVDTRSAINAVSVDPFSQSVLIAGTFEGSGSVLTYSYIGRGKAERTPGATAGFVELGSNSDHHHQQHQQQQSQPPSQSQQDEDKPQKRTRADIRVTEEAARNISSRGGRDVFAAVLSYSLEVDWLSTAGGPNNEMASTILGTAQGVIVLGGWFDSEAMIFGSTVEVTKSGSGDSGYLAFIVEQADGSPRWDGATTVASLAGSAVTAMAYSPAGTVWVGASFVNKAVLQDSLSRHRPQANVPFPGHSSGLLADAAYPDPLSAAGLGVAGRGGVGPANLYTQSRHELSPLSSSSSPLAAANSHLFARSQADPRVVDSLTPVRTYECVSDSPYLVDDPFSTQASEDTSPSSARAHDDGQSSAYSYDFEAEFSNQRIDSGQADWFFARSPVSSPSRAAHAAPQTMLQWRFGPAKDGTHIRLRGEGDSSVVSFVAALNVTASRVPYLSNIHTVSNWQWLSASFVRPRGFGPPPALPEEVQPHVKKERDRTASTHGGDAGEAEGGSGVGGGGHNVVAADRVLPGDTVVIRALASAWPPYSTSLLHSRGLAFYNRRFSASEGGFLLPAPAHAFVLGMATLPTHAASLPEDSDRLHGAFIDVARPTALSVSLSTAPTSEVVVDRRQSVVITGAVRSIVAPTNKYAAESFWRLCAIEVDMSGGGYDNVATWSSTVGEKSDPVVVTLPVHSAEDTGLPWGGLVGPGGTVPFAARILGAAAYESLGRYGVFNASLVVCSNGITPLSRPSAPFRLRLTGPGMFCASGYVYDESGVCVPCPAGAALATDEFNNIRCETCPPGHYTPKAAMSECLPCPKSSFQPTVGAMRCHSCPPNTTVYRRIGSEFVKSRAGTSLSQCLCMPGYYSLSGAYGAACTECAVGGVCEGAIYPPYSQEGFWGYRGGDGGYTFLKCAEGACVGGGWDTADNLWLNRCAEGHRGILCGACAEGFYRDRGQCHACLAHDDIQDLRVLVALWALVSLLTIHALHYKASAAPALLEVPLTAQLLLLYTMVSPAPDEGGALEVMDEYEGTLLGLLGMDMKWLRRALPCGGMSSHVVASLLYLHTPTIAICLTVCVSAVVSLCPFLQGWLPWFMGWVPPLRAGFPSVPLPSFAPSSPSSPSSPSASTKTGSDKQVAAPYWGGFTLLCLCVSFTPALVAALSLVRCGTISTLASSWTGAVRFEQQLDASGVLETFTPPVSVSGSADLVKKVRFLLAAPEVECETPLYWQWCSYTCVHVLVVCVLCGYFFIKGIRLRRSICAATKAVAAGHEPVVSSPAVRLFLHRTLSGAMEEAAGGFSDDGGGGADSDSSSTNSDPSLIFGSLKTSRRQHHLDVSSGGRKGGTGGGSNSRSYAGHGSGGAAGSVSGSGSGSDGGGSEGEGNSKASGSRVRNLWRKISCWFRSSEGDVSLHGSTAEARRDSIVPCSGRYKDMREWWFIIMMVYRAMVVFTLSNTQLSWDQRAITTRRASILLLALSAIFRPLAHVRYWLVEATPVLFVLLCPFATADPWHRLALTTSTALVVGGVALYDVRCASLRAQKGGVEFGASGLKGLVSPSAKARAMSPSSSPVGSGRSLLQDFQKKGIRLTRMRANSLPVSQNVQNAVPVPLLSPQSPSLRSPVLPCRSLGLPPLSPSTTRAVVGPNGYVRPHLHRGRSQSCVDDQHTSTGSFTSSVGEARKLPHALSLSQSFPPPSPGSEVPRSEGPDEARDTAALSFEDADARVPDSPARRKSVFEDLTYLSLSPRVRSLSRTSSAPSSINPPKPSSMILGVSDVRTTPRSRVMPIPTISSSDNSGMPLLSSVDSASSEPTGGPFLSSPSPRPRQTPTSPSISSHSHSSQGSSPKECQTPTRVSQPHSSLDHPEPDAFSLHSLQTGSAYTPSSRARSYYLLRKGENDSVQKDLGASHSKLPVSSVFSYSAPPLRRGSDAAFETVEEDSPCGPDHGDQDNPSRIPTRPRVHTHPADDLDVDGASGPQSPSVNSHVSDRIRSGSFDSPNLTDDDAHTEDLQPTTWKPYAPASVEKLQRSPPLDSGGPGGACAGDVDGVPSGIDPPVVPAECDGVMPEERTQPETMPNTGDGKRKKKRSAKNKWGGQLPSNVEE